MAISVAYEGMKQSLKTQQRRVSADQQVTPLLKENETGEVIEGCFHKYIRSFSSAGSCIHYFCDIACKYLLWAEFSTSLPSLYHLEMAATALSCTTTTLCLGSFQLAASGAQVII